MNNNNEAYEKMIAEIDAIEKRSEERLNQMRSMFEELNKAIDDVLAGGVVCG